jgi:hypothetical protein
MPFTPKYSPCNNTSRRSLEWNILFWGPAKVDFSRLHHLKERGRNAMFQAMGILLIVGKMPDNAMIILFQTWKQILPTHLIKIPHACKPRAAPLRPALAILALFQLTGPFRWLSKARLVVLSCIVACFVWWRAQNFLPGTELLETWLKLIVALVRG